MIPIYLRYTNIFIKHFALVLVFALFTFLSACSFEADKTPKLLAVGTSPADTGKNSNSFQLKFNKNLAPDSVNKENISLTDENGKKIAASDYSVSYKDKKIIIQITNKDLQSKSSNINILATNIKDAYGKSLGTIKTKIKVKDTLAPSVISYNLGFDAEIKSNQSLKINFSEQMEDAFVSKALLQLASGANLNKNSYELSAENTNKTLVVTLKDANLKGDTHKFILDLSSLTDRAGNKIDNIQKVSFSFLDSIAPKVVDSSIKDEKLISGQKVVELKFDEPVKGGISIDETPSGGGNSNTVNPNKYSVKFSADKKTITISFTDAPAANSNYSINLANITDLADNKINTNQADNQPQFAVIASLFVKANPSGNKDGSNWANAISLKEALKKENKTIFVASGTYKASTNSDTESFTIADGVKVYGGFDSSRTFDNSDPFDTAKNRRNLTGSILEGKIDNNANTKTLIKITSGSASRVLDAFVLQNTFGDNGGGIYIKGASNIKIKNLTFKDNVANAGGAIYLDNAQNIEVISSKFTDNSYSAIYAKNNSTVNIEKSTFNKNQGNSGGAISATNSTVKIENATTFTGNSSKSKSPSDKAKGGAIYSKNSLFTIKGATFTENKTDKGTKNTDQTMGGAIYATGKSAKIHISQSTFSENQSAFGAGVYLTKEAIGNISSTKFSNNTSVKSGGGVYIFLSSKLNLRDAKFIGNKAIQKTGAGVFAQGSSLLVSNSWFSNNESKEAGGAVHITSAQNNYATHIRNSIFYNNKSKTNGGALSVKNSQIFVLNSTFHKNSANENGGAIHNDLKQSAKIYNSIFWENKHRSSGTGTINSFHTNANDDANLSLQNSIVDANSLTKGTNSTTSTNLAINSSNKTNDPQLNLSINEQNPSIGLKTNSPAKKIGNIKLYYELSGDDSASKWASDFNGNSRFTTSGSGTSASYSLNLGAVESSGSSLVDESDKSIKDLTAFYVTPEGKSTNSGENWQKALDLKTALTKVTSNKNIILLAQGSYKFTDASDKLKLKDGVKIYGGFDPQAPAAGRDLEASRIDGGNTARNSALIQSIRASASQLLNGLVIENTKNVKNNSSSVFNENGGGLLVFRSDIELSHIKLQNNKAEAGNGGAIYAISRLVDKSIKISNSAFIKNSSDYAGALYLLGEKLTATIKNTSFTENSAKKQGGAIHSQKNAKININKTSFTKNKVKTAGSGEGQGGAIYLAEAVELKFKNSLFVENEANSYGSGIYVNMGSKIVGLNSAFYKNTSQSGGTIDLYLGKDNVYSSAILANTTFYNNKVTNSGCAAVHINEKNDISVYNSVFVNNQFKHTIASKNADNCFLGYLQGDKDKLGNIKVKNSYYKELFVKRDDGAFIDRKPGTGTYSVDVSNNLSGTIKTADFIIQTGVNYLPLAKNSAAKNKGDNALYLKVYDKIKGSTGTTTTKIPATDKDLAGKPRLSPATTGTIDIGAYEVQ